MLVGPSGGGQDDCAEARQPADPVRRGRHPDRRPQHPRAAGGRAAAGDRVRDPARGPLPAHDGRRQHRNRSASSSAGRRPGSASGRRSCSTSSASSRTTPTATPPQLSGGQRQRVGLARALAADPPVLLMDEPFGALDPITRFRLQEELRRLHREVAKTVIFVTHDIDEAIKMGDRIAILREGGVLAQYDTPDAILAHPADDFVAQFIGEDRALRRLALRRLGEIELDPVGNPDRPDLRRLCHLHGQERRIAAPRERQRPGCSSSATTAQSSASSPSPGPRSSSSDRRRRPRHPELRAGKLLRDRRQPLLLGLGEGALGRHAPAGARPAHRADRDRDRRRHHARLRPRPPRPSAPAHRAADLDRRRPGLHVPEHRALPAPRAVHRADLHDRRDRARSPTRSSSCSRTSSPGSTRRRPRCSRRRAGWA